MKKIFSIFCFLLVSTVALSQQTMYWIGGAGNWNDLSHWSFQSGSQGPTQPSSIPTSDTHVIFDGNSGLNGTGTTTAQLAARTVTLNAEVVIRSLTFDISLAPHSPRIANNFNIRVTENVTWQPNVTLTSASFAISMEPTAGNTSTLTLNGGNIPFFSKSGAGDLNIVGTINSGRYYFNSGTNNYSATTARFAGNNGNSLNILNNAVLNMPNVTIIESNGNVVFNGTAKINAPLLTEWTGIGGLFSLFDLTGTVSLNLPSLQVWNLATMNGGTATSSITIPNGTIVTATGNWGYIGTLNAGTSEFHIRGTLFRTKNGTTVNKVFMEHNTLSNTPEILGAGSTINELHFVTSNGYFRESMTVGKLYVAPSRNYLIFRNSILTITEDIIDSTLDCQPFWQLYSSESGYIARINNTSGNPINLENAILTRINVTNGVVNVVGVDNGSNSTLGTTLNFVEPPAKTIYWVGAAGDDEWNNQANWSATSGGPGGYCLPTQYDDVIFDNNSVITAGSVKVTGNNAFFHDITIQNNAPTFNFVRAGTAQTAMLCYGSWYMRSGIIVATDNVQFVSKDLGETITSNGSFFRTTFFHGTGGWTLQDSFQTQVNTAFHLYFRGGTLNTNNQNVYIGGQFFGQEGITPAIPRTLMLGSSEISIDEQWQYNHPVNTLNAGTSHIILRNGFSFQAKNGDTYYNVTSNIPTPTTTTALTIIGANVTYHNFHVFNQVADFVNAGIIANEIRMMPVQLRANLLFRGSVTTNILEVQKNGILRAFNNVLVTVNQNFITHTQDCEGLMEMYVNGKTPGQFFRFRSANNVFVPNVWMTGVSADLTSGATYTATGLEDTDVTNWTFTVPPAKDLYWIGVADNNWNNGLNWTTNTDGTPSAGGCVPTKYDNVHFNSFSTGNLPIKILNQPAYFNNLIAHNDAPAGITITYDAIMEAYSYGNLIQMGEDMTFVRLHLLGNHSDGQLINKGNSTFGNLTVNNPTANWVFTGNMRHTGVYLQTGATVTVNGTSWTGANFQVNGIALNLNIQTITGTDFNLNKGALKASDLSMTVNQFSSTGNNAITTARSLDIRNSTIVTREDWLYYNLASATLQAEGSHITFDRNFYGQSGHVYGTIETDAIENNGSGTYLAGGITAKKFVVNESKSVVNNNTFEELFIKPRGLTLWLSANSTQTVTNRLYISGTPCLTNVVRAGTETGATQAAATATINYSNVTPTVSNEGNTFDYVRVGGINASNSNLFLQVNATQMGLNTNVNSITGTPGLIGLGANFSCQEISDTDPATYTISAEKFYAGPEATFVWYKKINGTYQNLNLPSDTREIDVRNHGYDGEYKVDLLYDPLNPTVALRCPQTDEIIVSYKPKNIILNPGGELYHTCGPNGKRVSDLVISTATQTEMTSRGAEIKWYPTATSGTAYNANDFLVAGTYYGELIVTNTSCASPSRTLVTVVVDEPVTANAGADQSKSNNYPIPFTMAANNPAIGTGSWVVISGDVTITNTTAYNALVTLNSGNSAELQWVVTNGSCSATDNVVLSKLTNSPRVNPSVRMRVSQ